jgi:hypothetical protein
MLIYSFHSWVHKHRAGVVFNILNKTRSKNGFCTCQKPCGNYAPAVHKRPRRAYSSLFQAWALMHFTDHTAPAAPLASTARQSRLRRGNQSPALIHVRSLMTFREGHLGLAFASRPIFLCRPPYERPIARPLLPTAIHVNTEARIRLGCDAVASW